MINKISSKNAIAANPLGQIVSDAEPETAKWPRNAATTISLTMALTQSRPSRGHLDFGALR